MTVIAKISTTDRKVKRASTLTLTPPGLQPLPSHGLAAPRRLVEPLAAEFSFNCANFSLTKGSPGCPEYLVPRSEGRPLRIGLQPQLDLARASGPAEIEVSSAAAIRYVGRVGVLWITQASEPEPFLSLRVENTRAFVAALDGLSGGDVTLGFKVFALPAKAERASRSDALARQNRSKSHFL